MVWKQIVASTAGSRVMWVYTGALVVMKEGKYIICDTYRDGSKVWIEGKLEIDASVSQPQASEVFRALSLILLPPSSTLSLSLSSASLIIFCPPFKSF